MLLRMSSKFSVWQFNQLSKTFGGLKSLLSSSHYKVDHPTRENNELQIKQEKIKVTVKEQSERIKALDSSSKKIT